MNWKNLLISILSSIAFLELMYFSRWVLANHNDLAIHLVIGIMVLLFGLAIYGTLEGWGE